MRRILFFDGHMPRRASPVVAEYIRPNVYPRKSNVPFRDLTDTCLLLVHRQLQLAHDLAHALQGFFGLARLHRITRSSA